VTALRTLALGVLVACAAAGSLRAQSPATAEPAPAAAPEQPVAPPPVPEEREFAALLGDLQRYSTLAGEEARRELAAQTQALNRTRSDFTRVRVAVLHTLSRQGTTDDQRALQLLDAVVKANPGPAALRQLATALATQVAERVRVVREEQARSEAALQKLEALRAMERSLLRDRLRSGGGGGSGSGGN
jgi:isochorismate hydrolase